MLPVTGKVDRQRARYCLLTLLRSHAGIICGLHLQVQPPERFRSAFRRVCINVNIYAAARGGGRPMVQCLLQHPAHQPQPKTTVKRPRTGASARRHMRAATYQTVTKNTCTNCIKLSHPITSSQGALERMRLEKTLILGDMV